MAERPRCGMPCLTHTHDCDRSPGHTGFHRDVQQKGDHGCAWNTPGPKDVPALIAALSRSRRGGKELGRTFVFLAELVKGAFRRGETDPIGALLMLGDHLAELFEDEGGLSTEEHNRIYRALEARREGGAARTVGRVYPLDTP